MIDWTLVNSLQEKKLNIEIELNKLIHNRASIDKINELKSEILYLDKKIAKLLGNNELKRQQELKRRRLGVDQRNINNFNSFKEKYKKISKMKISVARMLNCINKLEEDMDIEQDIVKVKR